MRSSGVLPAESYRRSLTGATVALKMYSIDAHKGSHSCLEGVTYALGANDRGVTGAWESFVPLTPVLSVRGKKSPRVFRDREGVSDEELACATRKSPRALDSTFEILSSSSDDCESNPDEQDYALAFEKQSGRKSWDPLPECGEH